MADPVQIQNKEEIAEEIGSNLGGSLKKIFDKMTAEQQRIASVQKILNLEEKREKAVRDQELLDAIKGIKLDVNAIEKKDSMGFLELLGLGGFFGLLSSITAVVGGVTLGLTTEGALFSPKTFKAAVDNFKLKFPDFTSKVKNFFGIADDLPKVPDLPKPPDVSILDSFKTKIQNFFGIKAPVVPDAPKLPDNVPKFDSFKTKLQNFFGVKAPVVPDAPVIPDNTPKFDSFKTRLQNFFNIKVPEVPDPPKPPSAGFLKTAEDLVDARFAQKVTAVEDAAKIVSETADVTADAAKATKASKGLFGITLPSIFTSASTKIDEVADGLKLTTAVADTAGASSTLLGTAGKITASVAGRVLSIAGNPVFDAIAMGKDIFDIGAAKFDNDVKTAVKKEDIGAVVGGFIGGAIGAIGGPAGVALGVGLGNMAGEFVGTLIDQPEIVGAIETAKTELQEEKTSLEMSITDLTAQIKAASPSDPTRKLLESQLSALKKRKESVDSELSAIEGLKPLQDELDAIDAEAKKTIEKKQILELELEKARDRGDAASISYLQKQIEISEDAFKEAEKKYEEKSEKLRDQAQKTSSKLAESGTSFFDRMASEGGFIGGIFSLFGGEALEGDALQNLKTANKNELEARKAELEAKIADDSIMSVLFRSRYKKELRDIEGELETAHTGGRITETGAIVAQKGEVIVDDILVGGLEQAIKFLSQSAVMMRENGSPVVINNVNNSQSNPVISNQATTVKVPDAVRSGEPSFGMAARAMMN